MGQVAQGEYRRLLPGSAGIIRLRKLVDSPAPFRLLMRLALDADRLGQHTLVFSRGGRELVRKAVSAGAWAEVEVPGLSLDAPILDIEFRVEGYPAPRAVVLDLLGAVP